MNVKKITLLPCARTHLILPKLVSRSNKCLSLQFHAEPKPQNLLMLCKSHGVDITEANSVPLMHQKSDSLSIFLDLYLVVLVLRLIQYSCTQMVAVSCGVLMALHTDCVKLSCIYHVLYDCILLFHSPCQRCSCVSLEAERSNRL